MARSRGLAALAVVALLAAAELAAPDPLRRRAWLDLLALPLGYGHLIGAALSSRVQARSGWGPRRLAAIGGRLSAFALYTALLQSSWAPWLLAALLLVSAWHIVENDLALGRLDPRDRDLPPLGSGRWDRLRIAAVTLVLAGTALLTPEGRQWSFLVTGHALPGVAGLGLTELAAAVLLYHAFSFIAYGARRARHIGGAGGARLRRQLWLCHALPLVGNALLYCWLDALHAALAAPELYLFWSVVHAVDTARRRGVSGSRGSAARRRGPPGGAARGRARG